MPSLLAFLADVAPAPSGVTTRGALALAVCCFVAAVAAVAVLAVVLIRRKRR